MGEQPTETITVTLKRPLSVSARGEWFEGGEIFTNPKVQRLFERSVRFKSGQGASSSLQWVVQIGNQEAAISSDGPPVFVRGVDSDGSLLITSDEFTSVPFPWGPILVSKEGRWSVILPLLERSGSNQTIEVRFLPEIQQQLTAKVVEVEDASDRCALEIVHDKRVLFTHE